MSSSRAGFGYGLPSRPNERLRTNSSDPSKKDSEIPRPGVPRAVTASRLPSRIPQDVSGQRPTPVHASSLPLPDRQSRSWGSSSTAVSDNSKSHTQTESGSSSSATSYDSNAKSRNVLRRKKPSITREAQESRRDNVGIKFNQPFSQSVASPSEPQNFGIAFDRAWTQSPAEMTSAQGIYPVKELERPALIYPELDRYRHVQRPSTSDDEQGFNVPFRLATQDLPPPTPASLLFSGSSSQVSASPSTKFSGSPGPGPYSRDTTPTSISSQSPILAPSSRFTKSRQHSPAFSRPPVTRRRAGSIPNDATTSVDPHGLAAVRESLTSSSSSSTVRDGEKNIKRRDKKTAHLPPPPPSPPPRKSSQKFRSPSDGDDSRPNTRGSESESATSTYPSRLRSPGKEEPPRRPSRDGTPDMQGQFFGRIPIVHSNIPSSYLSPERRGSEPTIPSTTSKAPAVSSLPVKNASTSNLPAIEAEAMKQRPSISTSKKSLDIPETSRTPQTPSPKIGTSLGSRFPFFGRKKAAKEVKDKKESKDSKDTGKAAPKKAPRKGPVAGTGHEGYGKLGATRRRSGSISNFGRAQPMQSSQESLVSNDSFLADRVNPVVIAGGNIIENRNASSEVARSESNQSLAFGRPSTESKAGSEMSTTSRDDSRVTMWPSGLAQAGEPSTRYRRPSDSSDSDGITMKSTLAFRRSQQRLRSSPENPLRLPHPIITTAHASSPMTSFDTSVMSDDSWFDMQREPLKKKDEAHPAPKKLTKREKSPRRWNIFGRSQSQAPSRKEEKQPVKPTPVEQKPVAFYAMMDPSEQDENDTIDIHEVLRNAEVYSGGASSSNSPAIAPQEARIGLSQSQPLPQPSPLKLQTTSPVAINTASHQLLPPSQASGTILSSGRPSRLPQVGRIPKVVSNRPQHVSPKSFSRPFSRTFQPHRPLPNFLDQQSVAKGPSPEDDQDRPSQHPTHAGSSTGSGTVFSSDSEPVSVIRAAPAPSSQEQPQEQAAEKQEDQKEFLRFSPRKNSGSTAGTGSSSSGYVFAGATAVIPRASDPPAEDEVWDEYNDLIEDDFVPPLSATSSKGVPFHLETFHSSRLIEKPMESPTLRDSKKMSVLSKATASTAYSVDMTERIRKAFQPHDSPQTPFLDSGFESTFGPQDVAATPVPRSAPQPAPQPAPISRRSSTSSCHTKSSDSGSTSYDESQPLAQVNIRVGSMTVSKWLTFGHVLFSDVRHDLISLDEATQKQEILVIDGLGNDDWSFYAAETYPKATFYNLSPRAPLPAELQNASGFPLSPKNHHQVQYLSHSDKFPFGADSFSTLVYRFPMAAPESHYRNILTEARRVLKPGGYLELSILDADLNNMGNLGRRTVRNLKERTHEDMQETSLASTADLLIRLLGQVGFAGIKAARVGVPVAGSASRPAKGSAEAKAAEERRKRKKDPPSLAEMMGEEGATADEGITKMVARVGRWWYTRCYESSEGVSMQPSIWSDKALLRECELLGTTLKLMVCCARAPERVTSY